MRNFIGNFSSFGPIGSYGTQNQMASASSGRFAPPGTSMNLSGDTISHQLPAGTPMPQKPGGQFQTPTGALPGLAGMQQQSATGSGLTPGMPYTPGMQQNLFGGGMLPGTVGATLPGMQQQGAATQFMIPGLQSQGAAGQFNPSAILPGMQQNLFGGGGQQFGGAASFLNPRAQYGGALNNLNRMGGGFGQLGRLYGLM